MYTTQREEDFAMLKVAIALPAGVAMMVLGQTEALSNNELFPYADLLLHGGALTVLAYAVWHAYKIEIPGMRKELREDREVYRQSLADMADRHERMQQSTLDRHERWELERHADSAELKNALKNMAVTCAATRKAFCDGQTDLK
jgi:hypothetical protein